MPAGPILTLNAGSSNLKCAAYALGEGEPAPLGRTVIETKGAVDGAAVEEALAWVSGLGLGADLAAVGHRVVHGGSRFTGPVRIDDAALEAIEGLCPLAPLHQPQAVAAIRALRRLRPEVVQVAAFDTAFHTRQPTVATRFALPRAMHARGIRRYGFHGLSYEHLAGRLRTLDPALARGRFVAAHLGSGASLCAMQDGRSIDTTMGFSPLDGLVMATRPGSLDPGVVLYLERQEGMTTEQVEDLLYHRSGLFGVSGISGDMRTLLSSPSPAAREAVELFVYRAVRETGALCASLGGLDGVVFTGGVGENSALIRRAVLEAFGWLGFELDEAANAAGGERRISAASSRITAWVVPADEERVIARQTASVLA